MSWVLGASVLAVSVVFGPWVGFAYAAGMCIGIVTLAYDVTKDR